MSNDPSPQKPHDNDKSPVILVIGCIGIDRLLGVQNYPDVDAKVRTTWHQEVGGGNAANTAAAMGKLCNAHIFSGAQQQQQQQQSSQIKVKFLGKIGRDDIGDKLLTGLEESNVDTTSPLLLRGPEGSTTSFTTIVVSETEHTRTCLHTPGNCGELTMQDVQDIIDKGRMDQVFHNVVHLHSDSRNTDVSLALAKEAKKRGIPVSIDCEKDRHTKALDELLEICDMLFTNSGCLQAHIHRLTLEKEKEHGRSQVPHPKIRTMGVASSLRNSTIDAIVNSLIPSSYFARWQLPMKSEVVVTHGSMGALYFRRTGLSCKSVESGSGAAAECCNTLTIQQTGDPSTSTIDLCHSFFDGGVRVEVDYELRQTGVLRDVNVVDTTGCGDAFVGGFLLSKYALKQYDPIQFRLDFASFVGGKKLEGPGARTAQPTGLDVNSVLGSDLESASNSLREQMKPFNAAI